MNKQYEMYLEHRGVKTRLQAVADGVIRVTHTLKDTFADKTSPVVTCAEKGEGFAWETEQARCFQVGNVTVKASKKSGALAFVDAKGQVLVREPDKRPRQLKEKPVYLNRYDNTSEVTEGKSVDGARASAKPVETYLDRMAYECQQRFVFDEDEALYGLGSHEEGYGNLRGRSQLLYQHNMKAVVPVLVSTKGWGMLFDMGCMMAFHDDNVGSYLWADCADELNWYFFYGDGSYASAMQQYRLLTGEAPMLPRYALGYIQSKERYVTGQEMVDVAEEYRRRGVPLDVMVLDWQSWPEGQWGWKKFDESRFPDNAAFIDRLHEKNVKLMLSIWPSMQGESNADRAEMLDKDMMLGNRLIYNAFDPAARKTYWKQANENLFSKGVDAWWCDCSEPFESDWGGDIKPEPFMRAHINTEEAKRYIDPAMISLYSLYHSQGIYEGQRGVREDKRVCNLTRSSYAGQHRYATVTWSGDVSANWETLKRHIPEGLNFCAAGEPYWSTDIGGFFATGKWSTWFYEGDYDQGMDDLGYRELFVRWAQYAAFLPMMRAHGTNTPREIWRLGEKGECFYDAFNSAICLRYRLLPLWYSLMAQNNRSGVPMLRVPALVFPEDKALRRCDDQMMLGDVLLVKPVTRPMMYLPDSEKLENPDEYERVLLPKGHDWYDLNTAQRYSGGQEISVHAPLQVIPMFLRSGTILPWASEAQYAQEQLHLPLEIIVCPGEDGCFTLYEDAGDGYGYEQGEHASITFSWDDKAGVMQIGARQGSYPGMAQTRMLKVRRIDGECVEVRYTGEAAEVTL